MKRKQHLFLVAKKASILNWSFSDLGFLFNPAANLLRFLPQILVLIVESSVVAVIDVMLILKPNLQV